MKVVVVGAGVVGVTSAWYLSQAGHDVVVVDRQPAPGQETSFANAGEMTPGQSAPWAAPGVPLKALKSMFQRHAPLVMQPRVDLPMLSWLARMLMNCTPEAYAANKARMVRVAEYSRQCLQALREETGISYDERTRGTLRLFRTAEQVDAAAGDVAALREAGVEFEVLDAQGCLAAEPGLAGSADEIAGGLRIPGDETGDCYKFTMALAWLAAARGVDFQHGLAAKQLIEEGGRVWGVMTSGGPILGDAVVVAMGSYSPALVRPLGVRLPVYPVKGYSLTLPILNERLAPVSTVMDETYKVAVTRLGDRIRVGGLAEFAGYDLSLPRRRKATLLRSVEGLFGGAGDITHAAFWCGLRPMTPDGTPVVGRTAVPGLFLNTGHGTLGWTMAAGSGRVLADIVSGREAEIETADLGIARYRREGASVLGSLRPAEARLEQVPEEARGHEEQKEAEGRLERAA